MTKSNGTRKLAAAMTAGMLASSATSAYATAFTFRDVSTNVITSAGGLPGMIETVAYVGGIGLGVAGIFKLKNHVDNPSQHPMKDGLIRLGAGGGLLALPYMTSAMAGSINNGNNTGYTEGYFAPPNPALGAGG
jgi:hypothetical protein